MKILISANSPSANSVVHPRFGRADYLVLFDLETKTNQGFPNPAAQQSGGAGVAAAQSAVDRGVDVVISSHFGPNAAAVLSAAGVKMSLFKDLNRTCEETLAAFLAGELQEFSND